MPSDRGNTSGVRRHALTAIDALAYAGVVAAGTVVLALVAGITTGGGVGRVKLVLFLAGWLLIGIGTLRHWPTSPNQASSEGATGSRAGTTATTGNTRIESVAETLPPLRWLEPPRGRLAPATKLLLGGLVVLAVSYLLEVLVGVE